MGHPVLTFRRQKTEETNLEGKGDKLLLCCLSPGFLFIIQCENFLDESQGCLCMRRLVGMPVFSTSKVKRLIFLSEEMLCLESPGLFRLMKSQKVLIIFFPLTSGLFLFGTFVKEVKTQTSPLRGGNMERHAYCSLLFTICLHYIFMW